MMCSLGSVGSVCVCLSVSNLSAVLHKGSWLLQPRKLSSEGIDLRMLNIPWTAERTNRSVLEDIEARTAKLWLTFFGLFVRREQSLKKDIMFSKVEGKQMRGRSCTR